MNTKPCAFKLPIPQPSDKVEKIYRTEDFHGGINVGDRAPERLVMPRISAALVVIVVVKLPLLSKAPQAADDFGHSAKNMRTTWVLLTSACFGLRIALPVGAYRLHRRKEVFCRRA